MPPWPTGWVPPPSPDKADMNEDIDIGIVIAAKNATPAEHCLTCTGGLCLNNIRVMLGMLWEHGVNTPTIVLNPFQLCNVIDDTWTDNADTGVRTWPQLINRLLLRRQRPIELARNNLWHKGTFRGYIYGCPVHATDLLMRGDVVAYDPRARWFGQITFGGDEIQSNVIFAGASAKICIV